jgi:hypothetical protein
MGLAASAGSAQASAFRRVCSPLFEAVTPDQQWTASGPYYIRISTSAVNLLTRAGGGTPRHLIACDVASTVTSEALALWGHWSGPHGQRTNDGQINFVVILDFRLRRLSCTGQTTDSNGRTYETCTHTGGRVGTLVVQFVIHPK